MRRTDSEENLETTETVARRLGVSGQKVRDWTAEGLPVQKLGPRTWRYRWVDVEVWLNAREGRQS